ncbi:DUF6221 family protein [Streptomyces europaeiscabiei]|uniref:DUF6221 family protein n=1 Tax=Streptomyces europaeiscabiei TaxID=146819 RepID=UPI000E680CAD|nr:DUF6221 family protein [Streptomyces europaeiscabiei]
MDDLVQWLRAQLDEDQRLAERGILEAVLPPDFEGLTREGVVNLTGPVKARVLREIDAKRKLLGQYVSAAKSVEDLGAARDRLSARGRDTLMTGLELESAIHRRDTLRGVLRLLAAPYSDRPGFREEWSP